MHRSAEIILARMRGTNRWTISVAVLLLVLFIGLSVRASDDYRWSDWGFGDAQTMLSLRQWNEGGWLHNYLLFKPQGYAKVIDLLDLPELRHHAHGTCPGSSPRVGPRLWYTHYPAGYLIPYALLFRTGFDSLFAMRLLSISFSVASLLLLYVLFAKLTNPAISFVAVLFYALSPSYLGYADSIANQPIDDLLRFGFMLAVVLSTRAETEQHRKRWLIAAWVMEFCLSLASFDSVFFLYAWLIGWDLLDRKGFRWKRYLVFACAPVTAHGLQFLQNVWYLGFKDAVIDIKDAFLLKHGSNTVYNRGEGRTDVILTTLALVFAYVLQPTWVLWAAGGLYAAFAVLMRGRGSFPSLRLLAVLFLCGLSFILVLPHAARMPYEARQMLPFAALLAGALTISLPSALGSAIHPAGGRSADAAGTPLWFVVPYALFATVLVLLFWYRFAVAVRAPVYELGPDKEEMVFAESLTQLPTRFDPVYFDAGAFSLFWDPTYVPGYPQILPLTEYYAGSRPILCFKDPAKAADDIITMVRKSSQPFSPVIIARDPADIKKIVEALERKNMLVARPPSLAQSMGRYAVDLTQFLRWRGYESDLHSGKP